MSPAAELRAAARTLRALAADATRGPWSTLPGAANVWHFLSSDSDAGGDAAPVLVVPGVGVRLGNAAWIARIHPGLAEPLADWLEAEAKKVEAGTYTDLGGPFHAACHGRFDEDCSCFDEVLAVARVINGTEEETSA
ncbi:hypothetical protein [Thermomonospora cellulosilytica]|uniref:Uncharacterized protein n=1 Tax=Thermomonospora cellulosilytica TaxID=1411118 RepID=A0A7W3MXE9_9ACTN|nr:hypothetical protein [Thermomonospora cellulosilytica]MBA9003693.1 hypothetical protein [Thermomonospora cellulosilytica]